jgi:ribosomal protein S18 acetylase RimI-like enzyme
MFTMLAPGLGYASYVAVVPSQRSLGVGGLLLDDALRTLGEKDARVCLACVRAENARSIGLLQSRRFARTGFLELARSRGFLKTMLLWVRMVVAPGELVFARRIRD